MTEDEKLNAWARDYIVSASIEHDEGYPYVPDRKDLAYAIVHKDKELDRLRPLLNECEYSMVMEGDDPVWETQCGHSLVCEEWLFPRDMLFCAYCGGKIARVCRCPANEKTGETQLEPGGPMVCNLCGSPDA